MLGAVLGGPSSRLADLGILFSGGGRPIDLYLAVAQSADVRNEVIATLHLAGPGAEFATADRASVRLDEIVNVQSLPGNILQIQAKTHDRDQALRLTNAFTSAIARHLRNLNGAQVGVKQALLLSRFHEAAARLTRAQDALNKFRRRNRISATPEVELGNAIALKSEIEAKLQAKLIELNTMRDLYGPDNPALRATQAEVQGLRQELVQATSPATSAAGPNGGGLSELSTQYFDLRRDYQFAQSIYDVYSRLSEQVAVEEVSGRAAPTVQFIEAPHLDPGFHVNIWATAGLALLALIALFTEVYAPATGISLRRTDALAVVS